MKKMHKKHRFSAAVLVLNIAMLIIQPQTEIDALRFTGKTFLSFLFMLTPIFVCIGLMDVWIERETMIKIMGDKSGFRGALVALLLGMATAVPLYALLPAAGMLLKKGCRISNVLLYLCASAGIRIPLLLFEISSFGWRFALAWFGLTIAVVFAIAYITERLLSDADKKALYENVKKI